MSDSSSDRNPVEELAEEGQSFEAEVIYGVEGAPDPDEAEVTHTNLLKHILPPQDHNHQPKSESQRPGFCHSFANNPSASNLRRFNEITDSCVSSQSPLQRGVTIKKLMLWLVAATVGFL